jgi:trimethylamine--corrinoid protein Co-methyltransferase
MYGTAGCTDAQILDPQAAAQVAISCLMAAMSGANLIHDVALMGSATVASLDMYLFADEILSMVRHICDGVAVNPETLAVNLIDSVGPGGTFIVERHTFDNFRRFWYPMAFSRTRYSAATPTSETDLRNRLRDRAREIIDSHQVEPLSEDVTKELADLEKRWMAKVGVVAG